jgi:hypothetical protein
MTTQTFKFLVRHQYDPGTPFSETIRPELVELGYGRLEVLLGVRLTGQEIATTFTPGINGAGPTVEFQSSRAEDVVLNAFAKILTETSDNYLGLCLVCDRL